MEVLAIGKPAINIYLPLQEYPTEGENFYIKNKLETLGNVSAVSACLLSKWGIRTNFTGVLGNDGYAEKIRNIFSENKVQTKYLETNFQTGTATNNIILNSKTGVVTRINYNDEQAQLVKHKYDFTPDYAILDGTDYAGDIALMNNYGHLAKTIMYISRVNPDILSIAKKCTWLVITESAAEMIAKLEMDGTQQSCIDICQKLVDTLGKSNFIVLLNNRKILYSVDGQVKLVPEMKMNTSDLSSFDSIFTGSLTFALINNVDLDSAIKFADTAAAISLGKIGEETSIPDLAIVLENSGLQGKINISVNTPKKEEVVNNDNTNIINGMQNTQTNVNTQEEIKQEQIITQTNEIQSTTNDPVMDAFNQNVMDQQNVVQQTVAPQQAVTQQTVAPQQNVEQPVNQPANTQPETNMFDNPDYNMFDNV